MSIKGFVSTHSPYTSRLLSITLFITTVALLLINNAAQADQCEQYKTRLAHYEQLLRSGGSAKKMNHLQAQEHELENKLFHCRDNTNSPIQVISGANENKTENTSEKRKQKKSHNQSSRSQTINNNTEHKQLQTPINIQHNTESTNPVSQPSIKKLKECIKPGNVIDNDVQECMKGNIEPKWQK